MTDTVAKAGRAHPHHIAMFTPLSPQKTGIANYSWDIIQSMAAQCRVDVFVEEGYVPDAQAVPGVTILEATGYEGRRPGYDGTIFQIGNSPFHSYMLPYLQRHGGTVELHEANLNAWMYHELVRQKGDWRAYHDLVALDYPAEQAAAYIKGLQTGRPFAADAVELNGFVTRHASRVIVHNAYTKRRLLGRDLSLDITVIPHYALAHRRYGKEQARAALGIPREGFVFASFGAVAQNRRLYAAVRAMKRLAQNGVPAHLYITGGDDWGTLYDLKALARYEGVAPMVTFTGHLDDESFWQYLFACDAVLSLRWPYHGESSGVMCQALDAGRPLLVTDVGCFGELPGHVCAKIPPPAAAGVDAFEQRDVARAMMGLATNPALCEEMGAAAQRYAQSELGLDALARRILSAAVPGETAPPEVDEALLQQIARGYDAILPGGSATAQLDALLGDLARRNNPKESA